MNDNKRNEKKNEDKKLTVFATELDTTQIDLYTAKTSPNKFRAPKPDSLLPGFLSINLNFKFAGTCTCRDTGVGLRSRVGLWGLHMTIPARSHQIIFRTVQNASYWHVSL